MSESYEEYQQGLYDSRRKGFLRDMDIIELKELIPVNEIPEIEFEDDVDAISAADNYKEILIDLIINGGYDSQINSEGR